MDPVTPTKIHCTYPSCSVVFHSLREMKRHKIMEPDHEYCQVCDEDFDDEERLLIHKIKSDKHIVCPICGLGFKSEGGRDGHIRQNHRAQQSIICHGCKGVFKSASGMIRHIESDECPYISQYVLMKEQSKKLMIKEALKAGEGLPMPLIPDPADADDIDGGVKIQSLEEKNREAMINQPFAVKAGAAAHVSSAHASAALATRHWPSLSESTKVADDDLHVDVIGLSGLDISSSKGKARAASTLSGSSVPEDFESGAEPPSAGQTLRLLDSRWDANNFSNSFTGEYVCPCGAAFKALADFEEHVLRKSHSMKIVQCPRCHRRFKTTAALIAHCESASTRCDINDGDQYGQIIDELTGGVVQTAGYHNDGTVKYEAGKLDLPQSTTVGVNLRKVTKW